MTEHRPSYYPFSEEVEGSLIEDRTPSPTSSRFPYIETPPDRLLPILMLQSGQALTYVPSVCLHLVSLADGTLGLCNEPTDLRCPCCAHAMCTTHQSTSQAQDALVPLCQICAALSQAQRRMLHLLLEMIHELKVGQP